MGTLVAVRIAFTCTSQSSNITDSICELPVEFEWVPGRNLTHIQQSIDNLHKAIKLIDPTFLPLEVSTKSRVEEGRLASAMNLLDYNEKSEKIFLESIYQASKVFENGGPYLDLAIKEPKIAKQDSRLKESGGLIGYCYQDRFWKLTDFPTFYDWIYVKFITTEANHGILESLRKYNIFTDINYSQTSVQKKVGRSFNCQARSVALYMSLSATMSNSEILNAISIKVEDFSSGQLF